MGQAVQKPQYFEVNATTQVRFTPSSKAPPGNSSNPQTGESWAAPEAQAAVNIPEEVTTPTSAAKCFPQRIYKMPNRKSSSKGSRLTSGR